MAFSERKVRMLFSNCVHHRHVNQEMLCVLGNLQNSHWMFVWENLFIIIWVWNTIPFYVEIQLLLHSFNIHGLFHKCPLSIFKGSEDRTVFVSELYQQ